MGVVLCVFMLGYLLGCWAMWFALTHLASPGEES